MSTCAKGPVSKHDSSVCMCRGQDGVKGKRERTVSDIRAKVLANDDVPGGTVAFVKLLLDLSSNILLDIVLFQRARSNIDSFLLELIAHVDVFDDCLCSTSTVV